MADIKGSFSKGLTAINVKTSSFLELKKIQTYIETLNSDIAALEKEIGTIIYEHWSENKDASYEPASEQLTEIFQKKQTILEQTKAAEELAMREKKILGTGEAAKTVRTFCPNCGQAYDTPVKFCTKCGAKLQQ